MKEKKIHLVCFGAHAGDMELTCGGVLAKYAKEGHKVTIVHLTLGEKGHPNLPPEVYAQQKRQEAQAVAKIFKAKVKFLNYPDAELPATEEIKFALCDILRELQPDIVITHWRGSFHKDHINTHFNVLDGIFYAALPAVKRSLPPHSVKSVYFTENWEDPFEFVPEIYIDISNAFDTWQEAISQYAFARGETGFPYIEYYQSLARIRGIESKFKYAQAFMRPETAKTQRLQYFP